MSSEGLTADLTLPRIFQGETFESKILQDYWIACVSREASLLGRKDVLSGKGKFGIFGDGKEIAQVALAHYILPGDWRSGYYRDQTIMLALGSCNLDQFFSQLYSDSENEAYSGGRQMNNHFATPLLDKNGAWLAHRERYNVAADVSCVAGQVGRGLGLAFASKIYRQRNEDNENLFSNNGNEVTFCTIGDASTSEGAFWETMNAAAVIQVPLVMIVWDDGYGISVPVELQTVKSSISKALEGFIGEKPGEGIQIFTAKGWDYPGLCEVFEKGTSIARKYHTPVLIHVQEMTQPQGHSTSGSQERYKSKERMEWERNNDGMQIMGEWLEEIGLLSSEGRAELRHKAKELVREYRDKVFLRSQEEALRNSAWINTIFEQLRIDLPEYQVIIEKYSAEISKLREPVLSELVKRVRSLLFLINDSVKHPVLTGLRAWLSDQYEHANQRFHIHLTSESESAATKIKSIPATYDPTSPLLNGYQILNKYFDKLFELNDKVYAFGEDLGKIGDVNQGFAGLQTKYGEDRIFDTGIREWTIVGQAMGLAMRGLRPIAEIQYIDYLIYALSPLSDDIASLRYRSNGLQAAPLIIRSRGHRLEGVWHSGSPMGMMLSSLRGIHILVPRNMVQAAGFYQTMIQSDDPAIIIECLNGYRLKERLPNNLGSFCLPIGVPEIIVPGEDITIVTYGSCVRVAESALDLIKPLGISVEIIDVQTLLPFDIHHSIVVSLQKTNKVIFLDEDVPGSATAFMMQEVLENQGGYKYLDRAPITISAAPHRPPYGSDGDYFSKPNAEDVAEQIIRLWRIE